MAHSIRDLLGDQGGTRHNKLSKVLDAIGVRGGEPRSHQRMALVVAIEEFARNHNNSRLEADCKEYRRAEETRRGCGPGLPATLESAPSRSIACACPSPTGSTSPPVIRVAPQKRPRPRAAVARHDWCDSLPDSAPGNGTPAGPAVRRQRSRAGARVVSRSFRRVTAAANRSAAWRARAPRSRSRDGRTQDSFRRLGRRRA